MGYDLGVDLGTTYTAAAVRRDGRTEIVTLGTRSPEIPSVAFLLESGELLVGEPAERRSLTQTDRFAREFKRRIGDPTPILLGGSPLSAHALTARLLRAVVSVVTDREGGPPERTVVTCPANWSAYKRDLLDQAIRQADIGQASVVTEPEAAAVHYASMTRVGPGEVVAIYDLGGGTFDVTILRSVDSGFELVGEPRGLEHLGGVQFDEAVFAHVARQFEREFAELDPDEPTTVTALARLRRDCVEAKEALSADTEVTIPVVLPNLRAEVRLNRVEFEAMIRPALVDTIETMSRALESVGLAPEDVTTVLLVGGSSRIPLVAEMVARELRRPVAVDIHPKHAVAMGAARLADAVTAPVVQRTAPRAVRVEAPKPPVAEPPPPSPPPVVAADEPSRPPVSPGPTRGARIGRPSRMALAAGVIAVLVAVGGLTRLLAGGGGDDDASTAATTSSVAVVTPPCAAAQPGGPGDELVDLATFSTGQPDHIDPALTVTPASYQLVNALYDGLTELAAGDPESPAVVPQVAESYEANEDATVWTFKIRNGLRFSNGEPVLPSSFVRAWERASDPDLASSDAFLFSFIEGGQEKLDGAADTIEGLSADDSGLTLRVELDRPYASFDAVVGFQPFMPMPRAVEELGDQADWENTAMIGNGPFMLAGPRTPEEVALVRNPEWNGTCYDEALGLAEQPLLERVTLRTTGYEAFKAGEGQIARAPRGSFREAQGLYANTLGGPFVSTVVVEVDWEDPVVGGSENRLLRQAISQAIDRESVNEVLQEGTSQLATGITTPVIPGFEPGLCDYCSFDPDAARAAFAAWQDEGHELAEPVRVQSAAGPGASDPAVKLIVDNLNAVGITASEEPLDPATYFTELANGGCQICMLSGFASFLTYDSLLSELFHSDAIGRNNYGRFSDPEFDELIHQADATADPEEQADLYRSAERRLLNEEVGAIPLLWSSHAYVYNDQVESFPITVLGQIVWERVSLKG